MEVRKIPKKTVTLIEPKRSILVDKTKYDQKRVAAYCRVSTDSEEQLTRTVRRSAPCAAAERRSSANDTLAVVFCGRRTLESTTLSHTKSFLFPAELDRYSCVRALN